MEGKNILVSVAQCGYTVNNAISDKYNLNWHLTQNYSMTPAPPPADPS